MGLASGWDGGEGEGMGILPDPTPASPLLFLLPFLLSFFVLSLTPLPRFVLPESLPPAHAQSCPSTPLRLPAELCRA